MHPKNATRTALFALGFLSIGTQVYLVREFMMVFSDNELVIGIVLATWMMITGVGSFLGKYSSMVERKPGFIIFLMVLTGILPPAMVAGIDILKVVIVPYGSLADLEQVTLACILVQLPFCLLNGFQFSFLSASAADRLPGKSYAWESLGSMASGVLVNFIFLSYVGPFQGLMILSGIYFLLVIMFINLVYRKKHVVAVLFVFLAFMVVTGYYDFRALTGRILYPSQQVISNKETPYGQVVVTKSANQFNFFENGMLLFSSGNQVSNEENVHYAMVQHINPVNVLLISGGFAGTLAEILKYHPACVDYVELNPSLIGIACRYTRQTWHPSIHVHEMDARRFIRTTAKIYDVVLVNLPAPVTLQLNRYYSVEFLKEVKQKMSPGGIMAYSLPTAGEYVSELGSRLNAVLLNTLKQCFDSILIIPAGRNYFLASDSSLSADIPGLIDSRGIETGYVNKFYLDAAQLKERSASVTASATLSGTTRPPGLVNSDYSPLAVWYHLSWWLSQFNVTTALILTIFTVIIAVTMTTLNPLSAGLFSGGFTLTTLEIMLVFGVQVLSGFIFQVIGSIIMVFMVGLAAGSGLMVNVKGTKALHLLRGLQVLLAIMSLSIPFIFQWMNGSARGDWLIWMEFGLLAFGAAFIVGMEYRLAALLSHDTLKRTVAGNYSAEMFGSAAGAFAAVFLIPGIGMVNTGIFLAGLNMATVAMSYLFRIR
ncbi:MAG: hypothetical protein NT040_17040 [Bacteroidetes bacterium]|nr:hypothetical protein [Bacteroidota bacterium]